jgi:hypothetical protein
MTPWTAWWKIEAAVTCSPKTAHGYYHSAASYWANGGIDTLGLFNSAGASLIPAQTYGADCEGRPSSVTAASGQNPVSSVTFTASGTAEPIGSLTNVTFGSLDSDSFQYDPATGRMTKYTFNVNGQSLVGSLNWNANGTLGQHWASPIHLTLRTIRPAPTLTTIWSGLAAIAARPVSGRRLSVTILSATSARAAAFRGSRLTLLPLTINT